MASNYKQIATADVLTNELAIQLGVTVTQAYADAVNVGANPSGGTSPVLTVGTVTTTNGGVTVVIGDQRQGADAGWDDIIGNQQPVYTGTTYFVIHEDNLTALDIGVFYKVLAILGKRGGRIETWKTNSGQSANLAGAGLAREFVIDNNMYRPLEDRA